MQNDQIIQKIKKDNLKPISRNVFIIKKVSIWFLFGITTIFGAYAFAFFFLKTLFIDFDKWYYFNNTYNRFLIENIPIVWIIMFVFSLILMFYLFKNTNKGYKYSIINIGIISIGISFLLGFILVKVLAQNGLLVQRFENEMIANWTNPQSGRLSGEIIFIDNNYILIRDIKDNVWNVDVDYVLDSSKQVLHDYKVVSIVGKYDYENNFTACQIMPLSIDKIRFKPGNLNKNDYLEKNVYNIDTIKDICNFVINNN